MYQLESTDDLSVRIPVKTDLLSQLYPTIISFVIVITKAKLNKLFSKFRIKKPNVNPAQKLGPEIVYPNMFIETFLNSSHEMAA
jgi:hypothetical protein